MTEPTKRSRGRPKGSGKDDTALLADVADLVLTDAIKPTTAMKRLIRQAIQKKTILDSESVRAATLRRLQEKWMASHETLKAQAQARLDAKKAKEKEEQERRQRRSSGGGGYSSGIPGMGSALADLSASLPSLSSQIGAIADQLKIGSAVKQLRASQIESIVGSLGLEAALAKHASVCEGIRAATSWNHVAKESATNQGLASLAREQQAQAIAAAQQGVLYQPRNPWEESREQEALRKMMTGTYDPLTGRFK